MARSKKIQPSPRVLAARENGRRGGLATAKKYGPEFCAERALKGGNACVQRYGSDYFRYIGQKRTKKGWPKGKPRRPVPQAIVAPDQAE